VLRLCLVGSAAGLAIWAAAGPRWLLMVAGGLVLGCFRGPLWVAAQAYLVNLFPGRRRRVISVYLVATGLAGIGFPLLVERLLTLSRRRPEIHSGHVLHGPFALLAVAMALGALLYGRRKTLALPRREGARGWGLRAVSFRRGTPALIGLLAIHGVCDGAIYTWLPRVLDSPSFPVAVVVPGVVMSQYALAYVLSRGLLAVLPERTGRRLMLAGSGMIGGACFLAGLLSRSQALAGAGFVAGAFWWSFEYVAAVAILADRERERFGAAMAVHMALANLALFAVVFAMGAVGEHLLAAESLWMILVIPAAGFALFSLGGGLWLGVYGDADGEV